ncbi:MULTISPECIES: UvrD-helicase domain-containing protein [unclassified Corynebacterium]|uniref:UvrD-helicase domain-containing protein n=1 Tax=unclassified Corynebacterium TaxID=2624378 RepID=UPI001EF6F51B|nr:MULTISPECIES: UvrD-helicase domain-containing protein [unclassified Corynebacterium]MCG7258677.1 DEAD/DEAH box helicase [Corynebacterium sp. ACRQK]MCG7263835.1 DEAD/DEAH box helicase [Corynebacterium sp. ACRQL]
MDSNRHIFNPQELSQLMGQKFAPTDEQADVIQAGPFGNFLVVAGAGAGKTETMAARAVWMVANGYARPEQILGLTFTRKAAAELGERIRQRLQTLAGSAFMDQLPADDPRREVLKNIAPAVATYDSYAGDIVREYGLLIPSEPAARLITAAERWMVARDVVYNSDSSLSAQRTVPNVIADVCALSDEMDNHLVGIEEVEQENMAAMKLLEELPKGARSRKEFTDDNTRFLEAQQYRTELLKLVRKFRETLQERDLLTFGQQMSKAAELVRDHEIVGQDQRRRFRVVMLDEYQDTGHAQRVMLRSLFGGGRAGEGTFSAMAVGDPMQSIYQFRGATASNLEKFRTDFPDAAGKPAGKLQLLTSWRNPTMVLDMANKVSTWSMERSTESTGRLVSELRPRPGAAKGDSEVAFFDEREQELDWLADKLQAQWQAYQRKLETADDPAKVKPFSAAVLVTVNADAVPIYEKLVERGVPADMTAGPGLLDIPEVADVFATLRVLVDPTDDVALLRLLTGPRWNIGAADLAVLTRRAEQIAQRGAGETDAIDDAAMERQRQESIELLRTPGVRDELIEAVLEAIPNATEFSVGLIDALADLTDAEEMGMSAEGAQRLVQLGRELGYLRRHSLGKNLPDLVADIEKMLGVRTEVLTRWHRRPEQAIGTSHLDKFAQIVRDVSRTGTATPKALVEYLLAAQSEEDGLDPGEVQRKDNTVQILTVHKAKGLEWDIVAVPHASRERYGDYSQPRSEDAWTTKAQVLPSSLRGDAGDGPGAYPRLLTDEAEDRAGHTKAYKEFNKQVSRFRAKENDRLFYVAITRSERVLYVSGSAFKASANRGNDPSICLTLLHEHLQQNGATDSVGYWSDMGKYYKDLDKMLDDPDGLPIEDKEMLPDSETNGKRLDFEEARKERDVAAATGAVWPSPASAIAGPGVAEGAKQVRKEIEAAYAEHMQHAQHQPESNAFAGEAPTTLAEAWDLETNLLLEEFSAMDNAELLVPLNVRMTATEAVSLRKDDQEFALRARRPIPLEPKPYAKRGTAFHNWVEERYQQVSLLDEEQLPGASDASLEDPYLETLKEAFLRSEWADRQPESVEGAYSVTIGGHVFEGRIDAVFHDGTDPTDGWIVVDWKTGRKPTGADMDAAAMQLAVYRLAWAKLLSAKLGVEIPAENVRAAFHYVAANETYEPRTLLSADELEGMLGGVTTKTNQDNDEQ